MTRWSYLAQRAITDEWLHWELPLSNVSITDALSGPTALDATLAPEIRGLAGVPASDGRPLFEEWSTIIYAQADGIIRSGNILVHSAPGDGGAWNIETMGFAGYPTGLPYLGNYQQESVDPLDVVREIWGHLQGQPDGDLGVVVDSASSPVRIGTKPRHVAFSTASGESVDFEADEKYKLVWWEAPDCGAEIDKLAGQTPFDYREEHRWIGDTQNVEHRIKLGYPRLGRRRDDLRFVEGENLTLKPQPENAGDEFCNGVWGIGKGEGAKALTVPVMNRDGKLRRVRVLTNSSVDSKDRLRMLCQEQLAIYNPVLKLAEVHVADHRNARIGSWQVGDDIRVQFASSWALGDVDLWCRITATTVQPDSPELATLTLARSDAFTYGAIHT